jgi:hypothetical protein
MGSVGAWVVAVATTLPDQVLGLTSCYLGQLYGAIAASHLRLGPDATTAQRAGAPAPPHVAEHARTCLLDRAAELQQTIADLTGKQVAGALARGVEAGPAARRVSRGREVPRQRLLLSACPNETSGTLASAPGAGVRTALTTAPAADDEQERGRVARGACSPVRAGAWSSSVDSLACHARKGIRAARRRTAATATGAAVRSPLGRSRGSFRSGAGRRFRMPARRVRGSGRRDRGPHRSAGLRRGRQPRIALLARTSRRA